MKNNFNGHDIFLIEGQVLIVGGFGNGVAGHSPGCEVFELVSQHEEADTRMLLHGKRAAKEGYSNVTTQMYLSCFCRII